MEGVHKLISRFVSFPSQEAADAVVLWIAHTHAVEAFDTTPRLVVESAEKESGKTRLLEVLRLLVAKPVFTANVSVAALFRLVAELSPTVLIDEADTVFSPRAGPAVEELRGLINAGYRRGATVHRVVPEGRLMRVEQYPVFAAVALAGLGTLPDTILSRAITVSMLRRGPGETVEAFRERDASEAALPVHELLATWVTSQSQKIASARPDFPIGIEDRAADCWEPLLAIADLAGGLWPKRARQAAIKLNGQRLASEPSEGLRLLSDIRSVFEEHGLDRAASADLCAELAEIEEAPWGDQWGRPLDPRGLARRLKRYGVRPHSIDLRGDKNRKGYLLDDFRDAFSRYLPGSTAAATSATSVGGEDTVVADVANVAVDQMSSLAAEMGADRLAVRALFEELGATLLGES